ncbi:hypothetical protein BSKO_03439 [Bryopsis sp. KO-2023]|nr:hypothetical protein BSKO_03439 [Bryopsis sp. KO-2023]
MTRGVDGENVLHCTPLRSTRIDFLANVRRTPFDSSQRRQSQIRRPYLPHLAEWMAALIESSTRLCLRMRSSITVLAALLLALAVVSSAIDHPCANGVKTCPRYEKVETYEGVEIRRYFGSRWAQVFAHEDEYEYMKEKAYEDLSAYFQGYNYDEKNVSLTTPLVFSFEPGNFYKPYSRKGQLYLNDRSESAKDLPAPKYPVGIVEMDPAYFYIRKVNPNADLKELWREAHTLMADLQVERQPMVKSRVYLAMYNYPVQSKKPVQNEIWIKKEIYNPYNTHVYDHPTAPREKAQPAASPVQMISTMEVHARPHSTFGDKF